MSTTYQVYNADPSVHGKLWLLIRKHGDWRSDDAYYVLENFVRDVPERPDEGHALAVWKADPAAADAFVQYDWRDTTVDTGAESDDSIECVAVVWGHRWRCCCSTMTRWR